MERQHQTTINQQIIEDLIDKYIKKQSTLIVEESLNEMTKELINKQHKTTNIYEIASENLLMKVIKEEANDLRHVCINETSINYLENQQIESLVVDKLIKQQIEDTLQDTINTCIIEDYVEQVSIEHLIQELVLPLAIHVYQELQKDNQAYYHQQALQAHLRRHLMQSLLTIVKDNDNHSL